MQTETWIQAKNEIAAVFNRKITEESSMFLCKQLEKYDDATFNKAHARLMMMDRYPSNLLLFYHETCQEVRRYEMKFQEDRFTDGYADRGAEVPAEQHNLFFKCLFMAIDVRQEGKIDSFDTWIGDFNKKWMELDGDRLTDYLNRCVTRLEELGGKIQTATKKKAWEDATQTLPLESAEYSVYIAGEGKSTAVYDHVEKAWDKDGILYWRK